jgi:hypothetical protein
MIAQTIVEYGALHSMMDSFSQAFSRIDFLVGQGNAKYIFIGCIALIVLLIATRRRAH